MCSQNRSTREVMNDMHSLTHSLLQVFEATRATQAHKMIAESRSARISLVTIDCAVGRCQFIAFLAYNTYSLDSPGLTTLRLMGVEVSGIVHKQSYFSPTLHFFKWSSGEFRTYSQVSEQKQ